MPAPIYDPRLLHTGLSPDGLSYSVADDYSKLAGQAMADYEARTRSPRFIPGARVEQPDAPDLLKRELLDPLAAAFPAPKPENPLKSESRHVGSALLERDPLTGDWSTVYNEPARADNRLANWNADMLKGEAAALNALRSDPLKMAAQGITAADIDQKLAAIKQSAADLLSPNRGLPVAPTVTATTPAPTPAIAMGAAGTPLTPIQVGQRGAGVGSIPDAPATASQRTSGQVYNTPKGQLKWTGTGWVRP